MGVTSETLNGLMIDNGRHWPFCSCYSSSLSVFLIQRDYIYALNNLTLNKKANQLIQLHKINSSEYFIILPEMSNLVFSHIF